MFNFFIFFVVCGVVIEFASAATADNNTRSERLYPRFLEVPIDSDTYQLVDLQEKANSELVNRILKSANGNGYLLYTRRNSDYPQNVLIDDLTSIQASNFNPSAITVVLIHGWLGSPNQKFDVSVTSVLLDNNDVNVIVVDWQRISSLGYVSAVFGVPSVGKDVGRFLNYLNTTTGAPFSQMHLVGHSLGAHVAANAGRQTGGKVARITGLDPAGPLWYLNPHRLKPEDAVYVEAIHTNGLGLGIGREVADADFFPNGGSSQPGCKNSGCNHARSYQLFASSVTYNALVARQCSSNLQMTLNLCRGSEFPMGNNDIRKFGKGVYRLNTGSNYPYTLT